MNYSCSDNVPKEIYCNKDNDACTEPNLPELQATVLLFTSVLSCVLNGLLILTTIKTQSSSTSVRVLTVTLSLSYFVIAVYILPMRSVSVFYSQLLIPKLLCLFNAFTKIFIFSLGQISLACISIDRYLAIFYPLKYPMIVTNVKLAALVLLIFIISIAVSIPPFWNWGEYCFRPRRMPECRLNWKGSLSYTIFALLICVVLPIIIVFLCYLKISLLAKRHKQIITKQKTATLSNRIENTKNNENIEDSKHESESGSTKNICLKKLESNSRREFWANFKTQKIVLFSTGAMLICWCPNTMTVIWLMFNRDAVLAYSVDFIVMLLFYFNCCINPLLFLLLNRDNKRFVKRLFRLANR